MMEGERVLLIDLENCPGQIQQLLDDLASCSRVLICYAHGNPRIPLDWLEPLAGAVNAEKLQVVKMENGGKNAADFGICFFAGVLMQCMPKEAHFVIVSNDSDLDHAVSLLVSQGRTAERVGKKTEEKGIQADEATETAPVISYCAHLLAHPKTRPAKETTLLNSIKAKFKEDPAAASMVFSTLLKKSTIRLENGKLLYDESIIKALVETVTNREKTPSGNPNA